MMGQYVLSPRAQQDLDDIWHYTSIRWGVQQAELYIREIAAHVQFIADNPELGRSCEGVREGYYKYPSGSHMLFFKKSKDVVDIIRILHQHMDVEQHL